MRDEQKLDYYSPVWAVKRRNGGVDITEKMADDLPWEKWIEVVPATAQHAELQGHFALALSGLAWAVGRLEGEGQDFNYAAQVLERLSAPQVRMAATARTGESSP